MTPPRPPSHPDTGSSTDGIPEPLWDFCGRIWSNRQTRELLLYWQDHHGADVLLVLFAAWYPGPWTDALGSGLRDGSQIWQKATVARIRALRRRVKLLPWPEGYSALKRLELTAEAMEIEWLANNGIACQLPADGDKGALEPSIPGRNRVAVHTVCERLLYLYPDVAKPEIQKMTSALLQSQPSC